MVNLIQKKIEELKRKGIQNIKPMYLCFRFDKCNKNKCPLDFNYSSLKNYPTDYGIVKKEKCIPKSKRRKIATYFSLRNKGLTSRERSGEQKWAQLPEAEKKEIIRKLKEKSPFLKLSEKGYSITRKKDYRSKFTQVTDVKMAQDKNEEREDGDKDGTN